MTPVSAPLPHALFRGVVALSTLLLLTARALPCAAQDRLIPNLSPEAEERVLFVAGNTLFAVNHEIAHALIDQLDLPVLGREEDAADAYAALAMLPEPPTPLADALLLAAANGWLFYAETAPIDQLSYIDSHPLDEQRFYRTACLIVGSDIEGFYDYGLDVGLTEERIEECPELWRNTRRGWERLLAPHRQARSPPTASNFPITWNTPPDNVTQLVGFLRSSGLVRNAGQAVGETIALPSPVAIEFRACGEPSAFYDPDDPRITLCYELLAEFGTLFDRAVGVQ